MSTVVVDHNYGGANNLSYVTPSGEFVEAAVVRIYTREDFDKKNYELPLAITRTNAKGGWDNPVHLPAGATYVVQFAKEGLYGPDRIQIVV